MSQAASPSSQLLKSQRVLACVRCQQRKVKCDRKFPCANCIKSREQCVPATQLRRKRRFPERELLERLRKYEDLLRQNNIGFNPLHGDSTGEKVYGGYDAGDDAKPSGPGLSSTSATVGSGRVRGPKYALPRSFECFIMLMS